MKSHRPHDTRGQHPRAAFLRSTAADRGGRDPRPGISLVELLIAISMLAVLLTLTGRTMVRLMRAESTGIEALADTMSTDRMARDFRADLHDARTVALGVGDDDTVRLVLEREDGSVITWSGTDQRVLRHRRSADGVGSQDEYRVGASRVTWEWRADEQLAAIALHRIPAPHSKTPAQATVPLSDSVPARLRIEAVAARLVQVSSASSSEEARP